MGMDLVGYGSVQDLIVDSHFDYCNGQHAQIKVYQTVVRRDEVRLTFLQPDRASLAHAFVHDYAHVHVHDSRNDAEAAESSKDRDSK